MIRINKIDINSVTISYCVIFDKTAQEIIEFAKAVNSSSKDPVYIFPFWTKSVASCPDYTSLVKNKHCERVVKPFYIGNVKNKQEFAAQIVNKFMTL